MHIYVEHFCKEYWYEENAVSCLTYEMELGIDCLFNTFKHLDISVFTEFSYSISPLLILFSLPPTLKSRGGEKEELKAAVTLPNQEI